MTLTDLDLQDIADILNAQNPICRYELAFNLGLRPDGVRGLEVVDYLATQGILTINAPHRHPMVIHMAHCEVCEWCPVSCSENHSAHAMQCRVAPHLIKLTLLSTLGSFSC